MVMVDEIRRWPTDIPCFRPGSCHLTADGLDELHRFAKSIGLQYRWYQPHPKHPHYDLTLRKRQLALQHGAVFVPFREQSRRRRGP